MTVAELITKLKSFDSQDAQVVFPVANVSPTLAIVIQSAENKFAVPIGRSTVNVIRDERGDDEGRADVVVILKTVK